MLSHRTLGVLVGLALSVTLPVSAAVACACCAEPGDRFDRAEVMDEYSQGVLKAVSFRRKARLYTTAADWEEQIKGITNPAQSDTYEVTVSRTARAWTFDIRDAKGNKGQLSFLSPAKVHKFHADTKPQSGTSGNYVPTRLYKEWRLAGRATGSGMFTFKQSAKPRVELILHGSGNGCTSSDQFTNWTLDVTGMDVQFRFFGQLRTIQ